MYRKVADAEFWYFLAVSSHCNPVLHLEPSLPACLPACITVSHNRVSPTAREHRSQPQDQSEKCQAEIPNDKDQVSNTNC